MANEMRDRLVELIKQKSCVYNECEKSCSMCDCVELYDSTIEHIADHLIENGVVVPPVAVGQTVWYIKGGYYNSVNKKPCAIEVTEINKKWHGKILEWGFIANGTRYRFSSIGKTVFLTKAEAEQKLKEMRGGNE